MKIPLLDIYIVRGKNFISNEKKKEMLETQYIRNKQCLNLIEENYKLKEQLRLK